MSRTYQSHRRWPGGMSDRDSFCFDKWPQFRAQGLVRHQIHWSAKQVLKVELHAKVPF